MASRKDKAIEKVTEARPYVERALKDEDLRDNVKNAFEAARDAYYELFGNTGMANVAVRAATDKDVQDNLKKAIEELRAAADRLQGKDDHTARNAALLIAGIAAGVLFNPVTGPGTRQWVKERVFGPSDEFTYGGNSGSGSTPAPSTNAG